MNLQEVFLSKHALRRFRRRWRKQQGEGVKGKPEDFIRQRFPGELKEITGSQADELRSSQREDGRFFRYGSWVFVVDNTLSTVITIFYRRSG